MEKPRVLSKAEVLEAANNWFENSINSDVIGCYPVIVETTSGGFCCIEHGLIDILHNEKLVLVTGADDDFGIKCRYEDYEYDNKWRVWNCVPDEATMKSVTWNNKDDVLADNAYNYVRRDELDRLVLKNRGAALKTRTVYIETNDDIVKQAVVTNYNGRIVVLEYFDGRPSNKVFDVLNYEVTWRIWTDRPSDKARHDEEWR